MDFRHTPSSTIAIILALAHHGDLNAAQSRPRFWWFVAEADHGAFAPWLDPVLATVVVAVVTLLVTGSLLVCRSRFVSRRLRQRSMQPAPSPDLSHAEASPHPQQQPQASSDSTPPPTSDSEFELAAFLTRARHAFLQIQEAWQQQDVTAVRHFISDGLHACLVSQLQDHIGDSEGSKFHDEAPQIDELRLNDAVTWPHFDSLTVKLTARGIHYRVQGSSEPADSPRLASNPCSQYLTFVRRRGAQSTHHRGLLEGYCPACGEQLRDNQLAVCDHCGNLLRSGNHDWVLTEIIESPDWLSRTPRPRHVTAHDQTDHVPQIDLQHIEDRVAVIFFHKALADRAGTTLSLLKLATADLCHAFERAYQRGLAMGERRFFGNCVLRSSRVRGLASTDDIDYLLVELHWGAQTHLVNASNEVQALGPPQSQRFLALLIRSSGIPTRHEAALSSAHCPACHQPDPRPTSCVCESCQTVLNDGSQDWVLAAWYPLDSHEAQAWLRRVADASDPTSALEQTFEQGDSVNGVSQMDLFTWLTQQVAQSTAIDHEVRQWIERLAHQQAIPDWLIPVLMQAALSGKLEPSAEIPADTRRAWLATLTDTAVDSKTINTDDRDRLLLLIDRSRMTEATATDLGEKNGSQ